MLDVRVDGVYLFKKEEDIMPIWVQKTVQMNIE